MDDELLAVLALCAGIAIGANWKKAVGLFASLRAKSKVKPKAGKKPKSEKISGTPVTT